MKTIVCEGTISAVVVHDRGAVVTRRVTLPGDLSGDIECVVDQIVDGLRSGTARVRLSEGDAELIALRTRIVHPKLDAKAGEIEEQVLELDRKIDELTDRREVIARRRRSWESFRPSPGRLKDFRDDGPGAPIGAALDVLGLAREEAQRLDEEAQSLDEEHEKLQREVDRLRLQAHQISQQTRAGEDAPYHQAVVHLSDVDGLGHFDLSYFVDHARWWPTYTVHLDSEAKTLRLELEAQVAQQTGSDWRGVRLALSTAGLNTNADLPELASLRIGRAAPAPPSGYRPAPEGTSDLFAGYDQAHRKLLSPEKPKKKRGRTAPRPRAEPSPTYGQAQHEIAASEPASYTTGAMPPMELDAGPEPRPMAAPAPAPTRSRSAVPGAPPPAPTGGGFPRKSLGASKPPPSSHQEIEPAEEWLDFQHLVMAPPSSSRRGHLIRAHQRIPSSSAQGPVTGRDLPSGLVDPRKSRGHFDVRYDGDGLFEIPADGQLHKIRLSAYEGNASWRWRTAPRVEPAVYREVHLSNPLPTALLDGRARIFIDGEFAANSDLSRVDQGGKIRLGLGVEERVQVRRNARYEEASQGFLKGRRALDHSIEIGLRSGLGHSITVEVVDRVPVTDDDNVDVELLSESPASIEFDQADLGQPIRGGRQWTVELASGGAQEIRFDYRVQIRSRDELIGGNRREA